jgi:UDP-GlcNAc:undecaprenyl-phosphate GlcNAc-1-phosphate transferase
MLGVTFLNMNTQLISLFVAATGITIMAFIDDWRNFSPFTRFGIQILLAGVVVFSGTYAPAISNPFGNPIVLDTLQWQVSIGLLAITVIPLAFLFAIIWIVFVTNAMNWLDGSPGIVSGTSAIAALTIYFLSSAKNLHVIDQSTLAGISLIIAGAAIAFLFFDFPKPRVLMGDSGTMFLGFLIAVMAIFSGAKFATVFIVLGIPLLDAIWTIGRRIIKGKSPFRGDFQHLHHDLLKAGLTEPQVNLLYFAVSLFFGITALFLHSFGKLVAITILFAIMLILRIVLQRRFFSISSSHPDP